ncbi:MFS transporter [Devosia algicola]|uniref:MFS transporter n=1 Tax=Devosia algicola TaxID=3026418 RepID=A0ABY7YRH1_9HYPH|nr:MFS transporter [Devosia algicola]WDR03787.1 MFS transporter [Devosia algicola]
MTLNMVQRLTPELRASIFHFTVFMSMGVASVYLAIWLTEKGLNTDQIGIINAFPVLVLLLLNQLIGRLADRASDWRTVIAILAIFGGMVPIGLFFVDEFWGILLFWGFCAMAAGSIPPVVDAATVRLTQRNGSDFGFIRAWGTVGFTLATIVAGLVIAWLGPGAFLPLFLLASMLRTLAALQLPRFRAPAHQLTLSTATPATSNIRTLLKPWFLLPLIGFALVNSTHSILGGFAALVWHQNGVSDQLLGPLIATAAAAEAVIMFVWRRIGGNISARHMIMIAAVATVVRWTVMAFNPPVIVLFGVQMLHAFTFGIGYFGVVHFIANWTSEDIAAEAQGGAVMLQQAASVLALVSFGWLLGQAGVAAFFAPAALGAGGVVLLLISLKLQPPKAS